MRVSFDEYALDSASRQLSRGGAPVHLSPKAFELLTALVESRQRALSKAEIHERLWPATFVTEANLASLIAEIRTALGDDARAPRYVRTVHRFGYAFCAEVDEPGSARPSSREAEARSPYPGLSSFTEKDAGRFFGREAEVRALWERIGRQRLLAVIGPSGAGKTSFVRAGVVASCPTGSGALVLTPGSRPFVALGQALARELASDADAVTELFRGMAEPIQRDGLLVAVSRWRAQHQAALLVVDQFEELFTQCPKDTQDRFAALLGQIASADVHVLLVLRDDFLFRCSEQPALAPVFEGLAPLRPPSGEALRRALIEPAAAEGYRFEDDALLDEMLALVCEERGALPLLAFAAARLWEERDETRRLLTRTAYERIGGVTGALAQHAEALLQRIGSERTALVREIFRNLVTAQGTRMVLGREELLSAFPERGAAEKVLGRLVDGRLLTSYETDGSGGETSRHVVEVVHESLLSAWPRLVRWQAQDQDGALLRDQLRQAAQLWHDRGKTEDLLWSGQAYLDFSLWRERYPGALSASEDAFARAMQVNATRRRRRRRAVVAALLGVAVTVAIVTSVLWQRADASRRRAEAETLRAEASKLVALGEREQASYPTGALAYAIKSLELADTEPARLLALRVLQQAPVARIAPDSGDDDAGGAMRLDFSPSGEWVAMGGYLRSEILHRDGVRRRTLGDYTSAGGVGSLPVRFSPGSDALVANALGDVRVWSIPEGRELRRGRIDEGPSGLAMGDDGFLTLTTVGEKVVIRWWPLAGGESREIGSMEALGARDIDRVRGTLAYGRGRKIYLRSLERWASSPRMLAEHAADVLSVAFAPDGLRLAASDRSGAIRIWAAGSPSREPLRILEGKDTPSLRFGPRGRWLSASGMVEGRPTIRLWDLQALAGAEPVVLQRNLFFVHEVAFDAEGVWLATAHGDDLALWWLGGAHPHVLRGQGSVTGLAFAPDGRSLVSASRDGTVRVWPLFSGAPEPRILLRARLIFPAIAIDPQGRNVVVSGAEGRIHVVPLDGGPARQLEGFSDKTGIVAVAFGDEGRLVAAAPYKGPREEKVIRVWNLETGAVQVLGPLPGGDKAFTGTIESGLSFVGPDRILACVRGTGLVSADLKSGVVSSVAPWPNESGILNHAGSAGVGVTTNGPEVSSSFCRSRELIRFRLDGSTPVALRSHGLDAGAIAFDPSDRLLATGGNDGTVRVGPESGAEPHLLLGHTGLMRALAFSPDARWLASGGDDGTIRLWPVPDVSKPPPHTLPHEELLAKLRSHTNLRAVPDPASPAGYKLEPGPFPGWAKAPEW